MAGTRRSLDAFGVGSILPEKDSGGKGLTFEGSINGMSDGVSFCEFGGSGFTSDTLSIDDLHQKRQGNSALLALRFQRILKIRYRTNLLVYFSERILA